MIYVVVAYVMWRCVRLSTESDTKLVHLDGNVSASAGGGSVRV